MDEKAATSKRNKTKGAYRCILQIGKTNKTGVVDPNLDLGGDDGTQRRLGNNILELKNASLKFLDRIILDDFSYNFNNGDKNAVVGANGVGKSTFIKILTEQQSLDTESLELGETVVFGIYDQKGIEIGRRKNRFGIYKRTCRSKRWTLHG